MAHDVIASIFGFVLGYLLGWAQGKIEKEEVKSMATIEEPQGEIQVCDYCRMALHKKCEGKALHGFCQCQCERGY